MDYVDSANKELSAFYAHCLGYDLGFVISEIPSMTLSHLELLSFQLLKYENILCLISEETQYVELRRAFKSRYEKKSENYYTNTSTIYRFIKVDIQEHELVKEELSKVNNGNFPSWHQNIELHNLMCYILKDKVRYSLREFKLGVTLFSALVDNYSNLDIVLDLWIEAIKPYNFVWKDWLKYTYSKMIGTLISKVNFDTIKLKYFLRELMKYKSVIYLPSIYYTILKNNRGLYNKLVNKQILDRLMEICLEDEVEFENSSEYFIEFAVMYWNIDKDLSYALVIDGLNNEMMRPPYKGEQLMSMIMPCCIYFANLHYAYDNFEVSELFSELSHYLSGLEKTTQNYGSLGSFKWAANACLDEEEIENLDVDLYSVDEVILWARDHKKLGGEVEALDIREESLKEYYSFDKTGIPYNNIDFWEKILDFNYNIDPELKVMYEVFDRVYPSMYGYAPIIDYIYLPVAVLLSDKNKRDKFIKYAMDSGGEYGFHNIIRAYSMIGKTQEVRRYIEFLFNFIEMLMMPIKRNENKIVRKKPLSSLYEIYHSNKEDWTYLDNECISVFKDNPSITIKWTDFDEREAWKEKWAINHPDSKAYISEYVVYDNNAEIKRFSLVAVDGYRAYIPLPRRNTKLIKRNDYYLSRLFNTRIETLHEYIIRSGLVVE